DSDTVCDIDDLCPGFDDLLDVDADAVPNGCDQCDGDDATGDTDADAVCDDIDQCDGDDATGDTDADGVCDDIDVCPLDNPDDTDADGVCDSDDLCAGGDDTVDTDNDGTPDACDACPLDNPDDTDADGVCDTDDLCPGFDDNADSDTDTVPNGCDLCTGDDATGDTDADGLCDDRDQCDATVGEVDTDADGVCDSDDICMGNDATGDTDADGVCDDIDVCPGFDDGLDADLDGTPDDCDDCPIDALDDCQDCDSISWSLGTYTTEQLVTSYPQTWTAEGWFRATGALSSTIGGVFGLPAIEICGGGTDWHLILKADGTVTVGNWPNPAVHTSMNDYGSSWTAGVWTHYAIQYDNGNGTLYVDGVLAASYTGLPNANPSCEWYIGNRRGSGQSHAEGDLSSLSFSDVVRYPTNFTPTSKLADDGNTVFLFEFDEGSGTLASDTANATTMDVTGFDWLTTGPECLP
ncbi:MAG: hypothetical protein GWP91_16310, partial [Rhodobacterales bacterium]|nr:hypothetical protein [Rhodobacterales bacterium]